VKCARLKLAGGGTAIVCGAREQGKGKAKACSVCGRISERLCDWIVNDAIVTHGKKTCEGPVP
jgi:hypothetical protein